MYKNVFAVYMFFNIKKHQTQNYKFGIIETFVKLRCYKKSKESNFCVSYIALPSIVCSTVKIFINKKKVSILCIKNLHLRI